MTNKDIKTEIQKVIDTIPESVLQDILDYLKQLQGKTSGQIELSANIKKILSEDKELLQKLAQ